MDPKAVLQAVQHELQQQLQDLLDIDGEAQSRKELATMAQGIKEATYGLLQRRSQMRTRAPDHPSPVRDMKSVYYTGCGKRKRSDSKGVITRTMAAAV